MTLFVPNMSYSSTPITFGRTYLKHHYSTTTAIISMPQPKKAITLAKDLFQDMIYLTKDERKDYRKSIDKLYEPTEIKLF